MSKQLQKSPFIEGQDLLQRNCESMQLEDLSEYVGGLRHTILALVELTLHPEAMSQVAIFNLNRLLRKLQARLSDALTLIEQRKIESAEQESADRIEGGQRAVGLRRRFV